MKFFILLIFFTVNFVSAEDITLPPVYLPKGESSDSQAVVNTSTAAYKSEQKSTQSNGSSLTLNLEKTWDDSIASLDYSIRWDFSDIAYFNIFSKKFYLSLNPIGSWNITDNTKFKMYGFSINPWRIIIKEEEAPVNATGIFANKEKDENIKPQNKKKVRFSLYPIYNDLTKDLDSQIKDMLLNESFKGRLPGWEQTDRKTKKLFMNDLLFIDETLNIPGLRRTKAGFEYLGSEKEKKKE